MGIGCFLTVIATFVQTFAPYHKLGVFMFGRVLIGLGQGIALSKPTHNPYHDSLYADKVMQLLDLSISAR